MVTEKFWGRWRMCFFVALLGLRGAAGAVASELDTIGVTRLRLADPTLVGTGVRVALAEAEAATNAWQVNPATVGQSVDLFTYFSGDGVTNAFPNSLGLESGHADGVGNFFFGIAAGPAPGVAHVENYYAGYFYPEIIMGPTPTPIGARVVNQSFIFSDDPWTDARAIERDYDDYIAQFGTIIVSGAGNGGPVSPPSTAYNGLCVGAFGGASSAGPTSDGRAKPDLVAPAGLTSFSTPLVAGCAAVLLQAGARGDGGVGTGAAATDARTVKAWLLNGAVKPADWTVANNAPLDARYGAGVLNVFNSYQQLRGGQRAFVISTTNPAGDAHPPPSEPANVPSLRGWDLNSIVSAIRDDGVNHYLFELAAPTNQRFTCTATLVWHRSNTELTMTNINDLDLFLFNAASGTLVTNSQSQVDNVEHLFVKGLAPGRYDLQVLKNGGLAKHVTRAETYALAFEFAVPEAPRFGNARVVDGQFQTRLLGAPGQAYVVEASPDLAGWTSIATNATNIEGYFDFTNAVTDGVSVRFYRARDW